jgi:hypothetical protein
MNFTKVIILFLILISIFIIPVNAENLIVNGDFETGDCIGWTLNGLSCAVNDDPGRGYNDSYGFKIQASAPSSFTVSFYQNIDWTDVNNLTFWYYMPSRNDAMFEVWYGDIVTGTLLFESNQRYSWIYVDINVSEYFGIEKVSFGARGSGSWPDINVNIDEISTVLSETPASFIQFEDTPYNEYDDAIVNFSIQKIIEDYPDKLIYLEIATPKITEPYYNYAAYELTEFTGYRGLAIEGKHPTYDAFHNCSAYIRAYDQDMGNYETLLEIEQSVLWDNHTLINYTNYDYPTNKSYITGQNIGLLVDIMDYIETDFLGYPNELFTVWIKGFSNSNQGNTEQSFDLDAMYWNADRYYIKHIECAPFSIIDSDFNATVECYVSVYRNGNTTKLTPTIYTNMYASGYIPEGETGYIPPDIPEEPEEPNTGENETLPINPDIPNIPTVTNDSINTSWVYYYYEGVNDSFDTLCEPVYNFTAYSLMPIYLLNNSITDYNYIMNESFTETTQKINILSGSFNIIYSAFHPKIVNVMTYYLIWLVLLIILKKR